MSNVIDIKNAREVKDLEKTDEESRMAEAFAKSLDDISYVIAEALDSVKASEIGAAVAMQLIIYKISEKNEAYTEEYIHRGAAFFRDKK